MFQRTNGYPEAEQDIPVIERGVAIPQRRYTGASRKKWEPFLASMEKGDSFQIARKKVAVIYKGAQALGIKVTARTIDKDTVRFWRVK